MAALGWKADTRLGRKSALTNTGHSVALGEADLNGSYRPEAGYCSQSDSVAIIHSKLYVRGIFGIVVDPMPLRLIRGVWCKHDIRYESLRVAIV